MKFISFSKFEDDFARNFICDTIAQNDYINICTTFANGYTVEALKSYYQIFVEVSRGDCKLSHSDHIDTDGAFEYKEDEIRKFINAIANAENDFEVGFAYGRLTQKKRG